MVRWLALAALAMGLGGCSATQTHTFRIEVINRSTVPITVGLVKNGPPIEPGWDAPEDIAIHGPPDLLRRHWGKLVAPEERLVIGPVQGTFASGVVGYLRVYAGDPTIEQAIAFSRRDAHRLDLLVYPGDNAFSITNRNIELNALRLTPAGAPPPGR